MPRPASVAMHHSAGLAVDLGTTTLAVALVDMTTGEVLKRTSAENPQRAWGADVVSRITAALEDPPSLKEMSIAALKTCASLLNELTEESGLCVAEVAIAGNTVMEHLLLNVSPVSLAKPPYKPAFKGAKRLIAKDFGFNTADGAGLYVFPVIGGFVGGDAVAVALFLGLNNATGPTITVDIGTNSEIMLSANGLLYVASAAAGPAFEGGGIRHGMLAGRGAVRGMKISSGEVKLDVIGNVSPRGICGSGLIQTVSELLGAGVIDFSGRIKSPDEVSSNLAMKIKHGKNGYAFELYNGASGAIALYQDDIRALQTAKAAIKAGISVLLRKAKVTSDTIETVHIAGSFGASLDASSLKNIGLIDEGWAGKTRFAGDAALDGAAFVLGSDEKKTFAEKTALNAKYVPLSGSAHFEKEFIKNMNFQTV